MVKVVSPISHREVEAVNIDFDAKTEQEYRKKGVKITSPTSKEEWGTYFMFADPDGNTFWVFED